MQQSTPRGPRGSEMLSLLPRRRARKVRIDAEAEALVRDFRDEAYSEALSREHESSSDEIAKNWSCVALAVARKMGRDNGLDPTTRIAMNTLFVPDRRPPEAREPRPYSERRPVAELKRILSRRRQLFRIEFVGATLDRGPTILKEVQIRVADTSAAIVAAANTVWPARTIGLRILDREGHEVFARQKAARQ